MQEIFWLRKGLLAGRPGPDLAPWQVEHFRNHGFSAILSVNDGEMVHESLIESLGIEYACIPMSQNAPARAGDKALCLKNLPGAVQFIAENVCTGPVLVHCRSGKDRTGLVLAAYLMIVEGLDAGSAMDEVFKVRDIAFSAEGWVVFGKEVLGELELKNQEDRLV